MVRSLAIFASAAALFASSAVAVSAPSLSVNLPAVLCSGQPALVTWGGGVAPYIISVYNGYGQLIGDVDSVPTYDTSYAWVVIFSAGTSLFLDVADSEYNDLGSQTVTVQDPSSSDCQAAAAAAVSAASSSSAAAAAAATSSAEVPPSCAV